MKRAQVLQSFNLSSEQLDKLEDRLQKVVDVLYNSNYTVEQLDEEAYPYISKNIQFYDGWQICSGIRNYAKQFTGIRNMKVIFETPWRQHACQYSVLRATGKGAHLKTGIEGEPESPERLTGRYVSEGDFLVKCWLPCLVFPLRTTNIFEFEIFPNEVGVDGGVKFEVYKHEEMWSISDIIESIPLLGRFYTWLRGYASLGFAGFFGLFAGSSKYVRQQS